MCLGRLAVAPYFRVRFKDFFLGDQLMSLMYYFRNLGIQFHLLGGNLSWIGIVSSLLPGYFRLVQSFRRYYDSKMTFPHLFNALKYGLSMLATLLSVYRSTSTSLKVIFVLVQTSYSFYALYWDFVMDFGFTQRSQFIYAKPFYIIITILNILLRFLWITALFDISVYQVFVAGCFEVFRRCYVEFCSC